MNYISREEIREYLNSVYDLERLMGRISYKTANPRDLLSFKNSLEMLPYIKDILGEFSCELLKKMNEDLDPLRDLYELIDRSIVDEHGPRGKHHQGRIQRGSRQVPEGED